MNVSNQYEFDFQFVNLYGLTKNSRKIDMKKSKIVITAQILVLLQIIVAITIIILSCWFVEHIPSSEFMQGFRVGLVGGEAEYTYYLAGRISALSIIAIILCLPFLMATLSRGKKLMSVALVCIGILIYITIQGDQIPLISILVLILSQLPSFKKYMNGRDDLASNL